MPKLLVEILYDLKTAICPTKYDKFIQPRKKLLEGTLNKLDQPVDEEQLYAPDFDTFIRNAARLLHIQATHPTDMLEVHAMYTEFDVDEPLASDPPVTTPERRTALTHLLTKETCPLIMRTVFETLQKHPVDINTQNEFKQLYANGSLEEWLRFWDQEHIKPAVLTLDDQTPSRVIVLDRDTETKVPHTTNDVPSDEPGGDIGVLTDSHAISLDNDNYTNVPHTTNNAPPDGPRGDIGVLTEPRVIILDKDNNNNLPPITNNNLLPVMNNSVLPVTNKSPYQLR